MVVALAVPYVSNIEEAVTRHVISEQHVVPSNLLYCMAGTCAMERDKTTGTMARIQMYLS